MELQSKEWKGQRDLIKVLKPALSHDYLQVTRNKAKTAEKFNVTKYAVSSSVNLYNYEQVEHLTGEKNKTIFLIDSNHINDVVNILKDACINFRIAEENAELTESYESKINQQ